mmetsp:Transcript_14857/g.43648  ORF Transcript_14857/g.43648 Transcript_14857/m.43648 type:complete len:236 (+) Transcript_14857:1174-1881(+)
MMLVSWRHSSSKLDISFSACSLSTFISATAFSLASNATLASWIVSAIDFFSLASSRSSVASMLRNMIFSRRRLSIWSRNCLLCVTLWLYFTYAFSRRFSSSLVFICSAITDSRAAYMPPMVERVCVRRLLDSSSCMSSILALRISMTILRASMSPSSCRRLMSACAYGSPGRTLNLFSSSRSCLSCSFCSRSFSMAALIFVTTPLFFSASLSMAPAASAGSAVARRDADEEQGSA